MKKVLILESNEQYAHELSDYFERECYVVCGVTGDGAEGYSLLEKNVPCAVVTSLLLTNLDGFTVMERAKKAGLKADFVVLGNFSDDKIVGRVISLGARYYLMKPISVEIVEERVAELSREDAPAPAREKLERRRAGSLDERISNIFVSIGIPPHIKGYFARGRENGSCRSESHQQRDQGTVSSDRREVFNERKQSGACHTARDRSSLEPRQN